MNMKITVELSDDELKEVFGKAVYDAVYDDVSKDIKKRYGNFNYSIRNMAKEIIREVIKADKEILAKLAVDAAAVSIKNEAVKKYLKNQVVE